MGLPTTPLLVVRDGREIPIADSGAPIHDHNAAIAGVVLVFRDQTEERTAQKQLEESNERITMTLAEKDTLLRELFHRTKNTMQVISSMLVLQAAQSQSPEVHKLRAGYRAQNLRHVACASETLSKPRIFHELIWTPISQNWPIF